MAAAVDVGSSPAFRAVLVCQLCPYVWEPGKMMAEEFASVLRTGCPNCDGWVWLGELFSEVQP